MPNKLDPLEPAQTSPRTSTLGREPPEWRARPDTKCWVANVARDPNVHIKIENNIYAQKLEPITDTATIAKLNEGYARKYEDAEEDADEGASTAHGRVVERDWQRRSFSRYRRPSPDLRVVREPPVCSEAVGTSAVFR